MAHTPSDEELIAAYLAGEDAALDILVSRHLAGAYAFTLRLVGSGSEAEDIVQEAFVKAWQNLARYRKESASFKTWFMRIVRNAAIDHLRKKRHVPFTDLASGEGRVPFEVRDGAPLPDELAARAYEAREVEAAVAKLSLPYREVLALYYGQESGQGLTFEQMSTVLEASANTLKSRHRRALAALRQSLHRQRPL